ncbi:hypothetical protein L3X38_003192 [Prunus dulcis]|uniref:Transposable element protein n=1 Tax=Prunus dulcis TaxID=3755 RepID=A0AAD4ZLK8_PRUDU|nr:hypothetical protein L3X38_003192 [Prunus dulcis]
MEVTFEVTDSGGWSGGRGSSSSSGRSDSRPAWTQYSGPQSTASTARAPSRQTGLTCFNCGQVGHMVKDCPSYTQGVGQSRSNSLTCYFCGQVGHTKRNCPIILQSDTVVQGTGAQHGRGSMGQNQSQSGVSSSVAGSSIARYRHLLGAGVDYDCTIEYHPGRANVVADALSRKTTRSLAHLRTAYLLLLVELRKDGVELEMTQRGGIFASLHVRPILVERGNRGGSSLFHLHYASRKYQDVSDPTRILLMAAYEGRHYQVCEQMLVCQQLKVERQKNRFRFLHENGNVLPWIFFFKLPRTSKGHDEIWVIVDRLTKSAHFLPIKETYSLTKLAILFVDKIVRLHGTLVSIVSVRDARFTSRFWRCLQEAMGTRLQFSIAIHPQTDGQSERTIQTLEDMLRSCVLHMKDAWDSHLALVKFAYNNSYHASIEMALYEAL